jgi:hypothetical protein
MVFPRQKSDQLKVSAGSRFAQDGVQVEKGDRITPPYIIAK